MSVKKVNKKSPIKLINPKKVFDIKNQKTVNDVKIKDALTRKDGIYTEVDGVAKALAQVFAMGSKSAKKAVSLAKISCYVMEDGKRRELTTAEASAFVRSGYATPYK